MIYGYKCNKCQSQLEVERGINEEERAPTCFDCHETMSRVWDIPAIRFNGSGFYSTDNK